MNTNGPQDYDTRHFYCDRTTRLPHGYFDQAHPALAWLRWVALSTAVALMVALLAVGVFA